GLLTNPLFCSIWISTMIGQFLIVQYGGSWFSTASLTFEQWIICSSLGIGTLLWQQIFASLPSTGLYDISKYFIKTVKHKMQ
uniref:Cation-transporting P-type ATPase C-terminal domain-containing protein n=1 Tax=Panagrolaimus sp. ES5 TaxID=591445 RepID=A0AC34FXQ0_9BILA